MSQVNTQVASHTPGGIEQSTGPARPQMDPEGGGGTMTGWMWTWVTIGALVVVVVIGYLIGISSALGSIDDNLAVARDSVVGAGGDVTPLPDHVQNINGSLTSIDQSLAPVPGQADQIIAALSSIEGRLTNVDGSLINTSGSLVDTANVLDNVLGTAGAIESTLESAQAPADNLGTNDIWMRVDTANGVLEGAKADTGNVLPQLVMVNEHLVSICTQLPPPGACVGAEG